MAKITKADILKTNLLGALEKSLGVVTTACKLADCSRETFYKYCREDETFNASVNELENVALDFAESQLHKQIKDGVPSSTIFYLKTKGRKRGYVERLDLSSEDGSMTPKITKIEIIKSTK